jgi:hypothetical protein
MKNIFFYCLFTFIAFSSKANNQISHDSIPARVEDVSSIENIINALYDVISGDSAVKRNWDRMRTLFIPEGRLMATGKKPDSSIGYRIMTVEDYITRSSPFMEKHGFFERSISNKIEHYGSIAHVFSTYESRHSLADKKPFARGINSFQLMYDGKRWWVVDIFWASETEQTPLPQKYLP